MKTNGINTLALLVGTLCLEAVLLASCSLLKAPPPTPTVDMTQVYQTVEAQLTEVHGTPTASSTLTLTPVLTATRTSAPRATQAVTPTQYPASRTPAGTAVCDQAAAGNPIDVTIPDETRLEPGESFMKVWRLENVGTCTWTPEYMASFFYGDQMKAADLVPLEKNIAPGETIDIGVEMVAPEKPGSYQGNWILKNPQGEIFGIGPGGNAPFWVKIVVVASVTSTPTHQPTHTPSPTIVSLPSPTPTKTPIIQSAGEVQLAPGDFFDLDTMKVNSGEDEDLAYQALNDYHWLAPQGTASLGVYGSQPPGLENCQLTSMSAAPLPAESLSRGIYLCYVTNQGMWGTAMVVEFNQETYNLTLDALTWASP